MHQISQDLRRSCLRPVWGNSVVENSFTHSLPFGHYVLLEFFVLFFVCFSVLCLVLGSQHVCFWFT